jgi:hypothetical protein
MYVHMFGLFVLETESTMTHDATRRIAMLTLFTTCALLVALALALGLDASTGTALRQAAPLTVVAAVAFTLLLIDPRRG